jgi:ribosomal protein S18 acetylase RimI-like enzyme
MTTEPQLPEFLHDRAEIECFLRRDPYLHLYALGDLDDFFWPYTTWIAERAGEGVEALLLVYAGGGLPVVLAVAEGGRSRLRALLQAAASQPLLPRRFYAHFSPGLAEVVSAAGYRLEPHGRFLKMGLVEPERLEGIDTREAVRLRPEDRESLLALYAEAYPGNWFDPRMLETGCYYGIYRGGRIVSVAGIHVYSPRYRAAALGNITTHPAYRGQGLAARVTAALCQALRAGIDTIGLNVLADNAPALSAYTRLGFHPVAEYEEYMVG